MAIEIIYSGRGGGKIINLRRRELGRSRVWVKKRLSLVLKKKVVCLGTP